MASFNDSAVDLSQVVSDWKAQRFSWPKGTSRESVEGNLWGLLVLARS